MELVDVAAIVHHLAGDDEVVLAVDDGLHIVTGNTVTALDDKLVSGLVKDSCVSTARLQPVEVGLCGRQRFAIRTASSAPKSPPSPLPTFPPDCCFLGCLASAGIIVFKRFAISIDLQVQPCDLFGEPLAREDTRLARIASGE